MDVHARYAAAIDDAVKRLEIAYRELLLDLMARIWSLGPELAIPCGALREHGFGPDAPEPNYNLYW